jgi:hypothetical protein
MLETPKVLSTYNSKNLNECNNGQSAGNQNKIINNLYE